MTRLKSAGQVSFLLRFGRWVFVCVPKRRLEPDMKERLQPFSLGWLACWCDRAS